MHAPVIKLKAREQRMLAVLYAPGASVAYGLGAGDELHRRGLVSPTAKRRWEITAEGRLAIEGYPQLLASYRKATNGS